MGDSPFPRPAVDSYRLRADASSMSDTGRPVALQLLAAGVPLSLLIDLVCGPDSEGIVASERAASGSQARRTSLVTGLGGGPRSGE